MRKRTRADLLKALKKLEERPEVEAEMQRFAAFRKVTQKDLDTRVR